MHIHRFQLINALGGEYALVETLVQSQLFNFSITQFFLGQKMSVSVGPFFDRNQVFSAALLNGCKIQISLHLPDCDLTWRVAITAHWTLFCLKKSVYKSITNIIQFEITIVICKGGLISESIPLFLKSPKMGAKS